MKKYPDKLFLKLILKLSRLFAKRKPKFLCIDENWNYFNVLTFCRGENCEEYLSTSDFTYHYCYSLFLLPILFTRVGNFLLSLKFSLKLSFFFLKDTLLAFNNFKNKQKIAWSNDFWYVKVRIFWKCIQYTIHWDKTQMLKKYPSGKINGIRNAASSNSSQFYF